MYNLPFTLSDCDWYLHILVSMRYYIIQLVSPRMAADQSVSASRAGKKRSTPIISPYFFWKGSIIVMKPSPLITLANPKPPKTLNKHLFTILYIISCQFHYFFLIFLIWKENHPFNMWKFFLRFTCQLKKSDPECPILNLEFFNQQITAKNLP